MSVLATRRAALDNDLKEKIKNRVKQLLQDKVQNGNGDASEDSSDEEDSNEGMLYLFDDDSSGSSREARIAFRLVALEFDTRNEYEAYKKNHDIATGTKVVIKEEQKKGPAKEDKSKEKAPSKEDKPKEKVPGKDEKQKEQKKPDDKTKDQEKPTEKPEEKAKPKEIDHQHPSRIKEGPQRQLAIKDKLIDEFGSDAKSWNVHKIDKSQLTKGVLIKFPDGSSK